MVHVNSRPTLRLLMQRFLKKNKARNTVAVIAIIMTTILYMALFTSVTSVLKTRQQQDIRKNMDSAHISVQNLTKEQYEAIRQDKKIERSGYSIFMTTAQNPELALSQTEIRYADQNGAKGFNCEPTVGKMPQKENEAALSTITLDRLGCERRIGETIHLTFTLSGQQVTKDFVLSGYWTGDPVCMAQLIWVSEEYCLSNCKKATIETIEQEDYEGEYSLSIWCKNPFFLQKTADDLNETYQLLGLSSRAEVNPAYDQFSEDGFQVVPVLVILVVILFAGYFIIYNIFRISVANDIKIFGLLKNVGATGKQLRHILRMQAIRLSIIGIPIGLLFGFLIGIRMTPVLLEDIESIGIAKMNPLINTNPWIVVVSAGFSLLTVWLGCMVPERMVARVTPVEAVRFADTSKKGSQRTMRRITPFTMALRNLTRTWRKTSIVVLSLMLPILVLNAVVSMVKGVNYEEFLDTYISSDIDVSGLTAELGSSNLQAITPEFRNEIVKNHNIIRAAYIYNTEFTYHLDEAGYQNLSKIITDLEALEQLSGHRLKSELKLLESREVPAHIIGISQAAFEKMEFYEQQCTWEEFCAGKYVILGSGYGDEYYHSGDNITLPSVNGQGAETYTVLFSAEEPYDYRYRFGCGTHFDYTFYLPEQEYLTLTGQNNAMVAGLYIKEGTDERVREWIDEFADQNHQTLYMDMRKEIRQACNGEKNRLLMIGGALFFVLLCIGILNYLNTILVSITIRKREFALLEAVGMNRRQLRRMLVWEGIIYLFASIVLADTVGMLFMTKVVPNLIKAFYFSNRTTVLPSIVLVPVFAVIALLIPHIYFRNIGEETVTDRISEL